MVVATITGEWRAVAPTPRSLMAVLYLVVVGTFVGYVCYVYALKHLPVSIVSLYAYVNPGDCGDSRIAAAEGALHAAHGGRDRDYFRGDADCAER